MLVRRVSEEQYLAQPDCCNGRAVQAAFASEVVVQSGSAQMPAVAAGVAVGGTLVAYLVRAPPFEKMTEIHHRSCEDVLDWRGFADYHHQRHALNR